MGKNPVNDYGLSVNVPNALIEWHRCKSEINQLVKIQEEQARIIVAEIDSAEKMGYDNKDIRTCIGTVTIFSGIS